MTKALDLVEEVLGLLSCDSSSSSMTNSSKAVLSLYSSWFCPFAQRAWIALNYKSIPYKYNEIDPYNKTDEFLSINPRGLVPAIINLNNNNKMYESSVILEYLDDEFNTKYNNKLLFPNNSYLKFRNRIWIDHINKKIVPKFYQILQFEDLEKVENSTNEYFKSLAELVTAMNFNGPFFSGNNADAVDITLFPWAQRMYLLEYYKKINYKQIWNNNENILKRYNEWFNACLNLESFNTTIADKNELIKMYKRYADNSATSEVAIAVNKGEVLP